jgi:hypothetical protein
LDTWCSIPVFHDRLIKVSALKNETSILRKIDGWVSERRQALAWAAMLVIAAWLFFHPPRDLIFFLCYVFAIAASNVFKVKRRWVQTIAFFLVMFVAWYVSGGFYLAETASTAPLAPLPQAGAVVIPGGDTLMLEFERSLFRASVCFYVPDTELCVLAGHSCSIPDDAETVYASRILFDPDGIEIPETPSLAWWEQRFDPDGMEIPDAFQRAVPGQFEVKVVTDSPFGAVLSGLTPVPGREEMPIGGAGDIYPGEYGEVWSPEGVIPIEVLGFKKFRGGQMLAAQVMDQKVRLGKGMSGSPVIQNGKIIGFFTVVYALPYRGPQVILIRPACEVYGELEWYFITHSDH